MSLQGVRVALTASRERSEAISFLLEDEGAQLLHLPVLELLPPIDPRPFAAVVEQLQRYPWILLSSLEAVTALWEGARVAGTLKRLDEVGLIATDGEVARTLVCLGQPARLALGTTAVLELPAQAPELIVFDTPGAASALHRDRRAWLEGAVRVAGSAATAEELSQLGTPAHTVARAGSLGLLDAAQAAWKR
ncbi:MAG: Uroporphyrinogen-III synthase [Myxococcaceae bacterium]|nr:Uroporphyrinogen-III synthase [Myxococcaceae bacterium]